MKRDALLAAGFDVRHPYEDRASGAEDDRPGLAQALESQYLAPLGWGHINLTGDYVWRQKLTIEEGKFRALRTPEKP